MKRLAVLVLAAALSACAGSDGYTPSDDPSNPCGDAEDQECG